MIVDKCAKMVYNIYINLSKALTAHNTNFDLKLHYLLGK